MDDVLRRPGIAVFERDAAGETLEFLSRRPYENVYLHWVVSNATSGEQRQRIRLWRDGAGAVTGVVSFAASYVIATDDAAAIAAFANEARRQPPARMIVCPKKTADAFWNAVSVWHRPPTTIRAHQPLYALTADTLTGAVTAVATRPATIAETPLVTDHSASMTLGELGYDPRRVRRDFAGAMERLAARQWIWVWIESGELRFMCTIGSTTDRTAQIQGVWTPPELRGRGYAASALSSICAQLLEKFPSLNLYVNDFNSDAIRLYERVGFRRVGELATYLFHENTGRLSGV